jgi:hypothetical protein
MFAKLISPNRALAIVGFAFASPLSAQLSNPLSDPLPSGVSVAVEEWLTIPASNNSAPRARINHLKPHPDGSRLFCNDLNGKLWSTASKEATQPTLFLDIAVQFPQFIKAPGLGTGFTSFTFHPEFLTPESAGFGVFYTAHSEQAEAGRTVDFSGPVSTATSQVGVVTEWTLNDPSATAIVANPSNFTRRTVIEIGFPFDFHDLQEISFNSTAQPGSEDYGALFLCIGDGGSTVQDKPANLNRIDSPLGSIHRITPFLLASHAPGDFIPSTNGKYFIPSGESNQNPYVDTIDPTPGDGYPVVREIYANGFRNPHRITWDSAGTHKMFCGNIGEAVIEEVELVEKGRNYGWPNREGSFHFTYLDKGNVYPLPNPDDTGLTYPVVQYDHSAGFAIVGGSVYRGSAIPELQGSYLFGDIVRGRVWIAPETNMNLQATTNTGETPATATELALKTGGTTASLLSIIGASRADLRFGTDHEGEIYLLSKFNGTLYKVLKDNSPSDNTPQGGQEDWVSVRDFEDGSKDGFTTIPAASGSLSIVNDPREGPVNRVLRLQAHGSESALTARLPIPEIPDDSFGTVYLRFLVPGQDHDINFGLSDVANASAYGDFETQARSTSFADGRLQVRDGGDFVDAINVDGGTWYSVWYQISNRQGSSEDTWNLYFQGGEFSTPTLVKTRVRFRNGTTQSLKSFLWIVSAASEQGLQEMYFDDLFIDVGNSNITDPVSKGWQLVDQFEDPAPLEAWQLPAEGEQLVEIITEPSGNHYLRHAASPDSSTNGAAIAAKRLPFTTQVSQTITTYFRLRIEGDALDHSFGVSALNPVDAASFSRDELEPELRVSRGGALSVYDGAAGAKDYVATNGLDGLSVDTWYRIWLVANNGGFASGGQTWTAYAQGGEFSKPTAITPKLFFRRSAENPITDFVTIASNSAGGNAAIQLDDIFASRGENFSDPIGATSLPLTIEKVPDGVEIAWPSTENRLFQPYESSDLRNWTQLAEPQEGDGFARTFSNSLSKPRRFYRTLELSRRSFRDASWSTSFPNSQLPAGITLVRAKPSVTWNLTPGALQLTNTSASSVAGMVRRPGGYALSPGDWRNMTLTVEGRSLESSSVAIRDLCLIFGYQDDTHFYYAHLSQQSDGQFHTLIMKVSGNSRETIHVPIPEGPNAGPLTSSLENGLFQTLRVSHQATGQIEVFVDDFSEPVLTAQDTTYPVGRVGCGTFDDRAVFREITVSGERP